MNTLIGLTKTFIRQAAFWLLFFALGRIIFLLFYSSYLRGIDIVSIMAIFWHGLKLDISTLCFILTIPFLVFSFGVFIRKAWVLYVIKFYTYIIISIYALISISEAGIYADWLTKLNSKVVKYLTHPSEIYNSASTGVFLLLLLILFLMSVAGMFAYTKWIHKKTKVPEMHYFRYSLFMIVMTMLLIVGMRGGLQQIPVNQSDAYFSKRNILNQVAVNPAWNLFHSLHQNFYSIEKNPFVFYDRIEAEALINKLYEVEKDTTNIILENTKPNILLIILEGWSSDVVGCCGGEQEITPGFDSLAKNGILFDNCYSTGSRSDQGMASILSAFPSTPLATITLQPDKFAKLPSITERLISMNYQTSFYFGGQLIYGNIKGFIFHNGFNKITEGKDFSSSVPRGKLGVHDEFMYPVLLSDLAGEEQPFFSVVFTMSSHSPYDYPRPVKKFHFDLESDYANSVFYSDSCLFDFIHKAENETWFKNTLFVFVSDHGHSSPSGRGYDSPGYQRIPLLLYGDVIKKEYRGANYESPVSQLDIASTILHQLGQESTEFRWSKNLFNPMSKSFAYYAYEVGLGFVTSEGNFNYNCDLKSFPEMNLPNSKKDSIVKIGKAYLQQVYQEYFDY